MYIHLGYRPNFKPKAASSPPIVCKHIQTLGECRGGAYGVCLIGGGLQIVREPVLKVAWITLGSCSWAWLGRSVGS